MVLALKGSLGFLFYTLEFSDDSFEKPSWQKPTKQFGKIRHPDGYASGFPIRLSLPEYVQASLGEVMGKLTFGLEF